MSRSNIFQDYSIVPWYNNDEWESVYELIFSETSTAEDKKTALNTLIIWQQRMPLLPSGVEGTLCILEALLADEMIISERQYQILGASSIMRFLNICVASRAQVNNFTKTAKEYGIPDWIITIRHDFAHSQKLPTVTILKLALQECFVWLKNTYWKTEQEVMSMKITIKEKLTNGKRRKMSLEECSIPMHKLVGLYCSMLVYDSLEMCYDEFIQEQLEVLETYGIKKDYYIKILILIEQTMVNNMTSTEWKKCLIEMIDSSFFTVDLSSLKNKNGNNEIVKNFSGFMNLLEKQNLLTDILLELKYVIADNRELETARVGAAKWINEIFNAMNALRMKQKKTSNEKIKSVIQFNQLHNSTLESIKIRLKSLLLIDVPESYHKYYINSYQELWKNSNDINIIVKNVCKKVQLNTVDEMDIDDLCKMQTKEEDYMKLISIHFSNNEENYKEQKQENKIKETKIESQQENIIYGCWTMVNDTSMFETCAIGVLPEL